MKNQLIGESRENDIVLLGSQGPSIFFYGFSFLREDAFVGNASFEYYQLLIKQSIYETFKVMFNYISKEESEVKKNILLLYVRGFLNSYSFSRNTQPYIYYFGGYEASNTPWDKSSLRRFELETKLDILYQQAVKEDTALKNIFRINKDDLQVISEMFYNLAIDVYSLFSIRKNTFFKNYMNMKRRLFILNNEMTFLPKLILKWMQKPQTHAFFRSNTVAQTDRYDFLNLRKNKWKHPTEGYEVDITYVELVDEAKEEIPFINAILKEYKAGHDITKPLRQFSMDLNYCGLPIGSEPKYFDVLFED